MTQQLKEILKLPLEERVQIVKEIWDSINDDSKEITLNLSDKVKNELDFRSQRLTEGKCSTYSVSSAIDSIRNSKI